MPRTNFYESSRAVFPRAWCKRTSYAFFQTRNIGLQRSPFSYFWAVGASDLPGSSLGPAITSGSDRIRIISFSMFPRLVSTAQQSRWIADKRNWTLDEGNHYGRTVYSGLAAFLLIAQPRIRTNAGCRSNRLVDCSKQTVTLSRPPNPRPQSSIYSVRVL